MKEELKLAVKPKGHTARYREEEEMAFIEKTPEEIEQ